jgi:hypothetical protein
MRKDFDYKVWFMRPSKLLKNWELKQLLWNWNYFIWRTNWFLKHESKNGREYKHVESNYSEFIFTARPEIVILRQYWFMFWKPVKTGYFTGSITDRGRHR